VGAVDSRGVRAPFSSVGASLNRTDPNLKPEVSAPGVQLVSTAPGAHYVTVTGTSPATAIVAGVLALILQARPALRPGGTGNVVAVKNALVLGSVKASGQLLPHDPWYGYGIIDGPGTLARL
jgi:subtilisin family serine protease